MNPETPITARQERDRRTFAEVKREAGRHRCLRHPRNVLVVGMKEGAYVPQCNRCLKEGLLPVLGEAPSRTLERSKRMVETAIAKREQGLQALSPQEVRTLLPVGKATDNEISVFIRYCQAVSADPWAKEVYLVKYDEKAVAAIVLALNWYLKRASHNPAYESYESGVIVKREGKYIDVVGSVVYEGDMLFGGWCKVYKKGTHRPFERRVAMAEYDRHQFGWKNMPATMIEKVAIVQGIRRAFPDEFTGFAEKGELPVVLEGEVEELPPDAAPPAQEGPQEEQEPAAESGDAQAAQTPAKGRFENVGQLMERVNKTYRERPLSTVQVLSILNVPYLGAIRETYPDLAVAWDKIVASQEEKP